MRTNIDKSKLREFGYLIGIGIPLIFGFIIPIITGHQFRIWTLIISFPFLILGIFSPNKLRIFYKGWMKLGNILGWVNSKLILGLVFFLVLQPIALIMKFFNYDPLKNKRNNKKSYREVISDKKIDLTRIF